jgi:hypothetical protein
MKSILDQLCLDLSARIPSRLPMTERIALLRQLEDEKIPINLLQDCGHHDHGSTIIDDQVLKLKPFEIQTGKILNFPVARDGFAN